MLNIISPQENANPSSEPAPHTRQDGQNKKDLRSASEDVDKPNSHKPLVGMQNGAVLLENSSRVL